MVTEHPVRPASVDPSTARTQTSFAPAHQARLSALARFVPKHSRTVALLWVLLLPAGVYGASHVSNRLSLDFSLPAVSPATRPRRRSFTCTATAATPTRRSCSCPSARPERGPGSLRADAIDGAAALITIAVDQLRETAAERLPTAPVRLGLEDGVRLLARQAAGRGNFECEVRVHPDSVGVDAQVALSIIRELLTNVERHAHASRVSVEVAPVPGGHVRITVADDGTGLSKARMRTAVTEGHIGLSLVAARIEELGGTFDIARKGVRGTRFEIDLPTSTADPVDPAG